MLFPARAFVQRASQKQGCADRSANQNQAADQEKQNFEDTGTFFFGFGGVFFSHGVFLSLLGMNELSLSK
jgi:hypothetical protein